MQCMLRRNYGGEGAVGERRGGLSDVRGGGQDRGED